MNLFRICRLLKVWLISTLQARRGGGERRAAGLLAQSNKAESALGGMREERELFSDFNEALLPSPIQFRRRQRPPTPDRDRQYQWGERGKRIEGKGSENWLAAEEGNAVAMSYSPKKGALCTVVARKKDQSQDRAKGEGKRNG